MSGSAAPDTDHARALGAGPSAPSAGQHPWTPTGVQARTRRQRNASVSHRRRDMSASCGPARTAVPRPPGASCRLRHGFLPRRHGGRASVERRPASGRRSAAGVPESGKVTLKAAKLASRSRSIDQAAAPRRQDRRHPRRRRRQLDLPGDACRLRNRGHRLLAYLRTSPNGIRPCGGLRLVREAEPRSSASRPLEVASTSVIRTGVAPCLRDSAKPDRAEIEGARELAFFRKHRHSACATHALKAEGVAIGSEAWSRRPTRPPWLTHTA